MTEMESCSVCKISKNLTEFRYIPSLSTRYPQCTTCEKIARKTRYDVNKEKRAAANKEYRRLNADRISEQRKRYRAANKEKIANSTKKWRKENAEYVKAKKKEYYEQNKDQIDTKKREWRKVNIEHAKQKDKERYLANKVKLNQQSKAYYNANKDAIKERRKKYRSENALKIREQIRNGMSRNPCLRLSIALRGRVRKALKTGAGFMKLLGCNIDFAREWIEYNFEVDEALGFTWDNHGEVWHLDHVKPCASFNLEKEDERAACFNWTNLAPVSKSYNYSKGGRLDEEAIRKQQERVNDFWETLDTAAV